MPPPLEEPALFKIPTYTDATKSWTYTEFSTVIAFRDFLTPLFKEPGKYNLDEVSFVFNEQGRLFNKNGYYCPYTEGGRDYIKYWNDEKEKCREGVIYIGKNDSWYLPRDYYMWVNFLPIYNKELGTFSFPNIYDTQLHMALYEKLAELNYLHSVLLKKRQIAAQQPHSEPVLAQYGWTTMGSVKVGDKLWNPDSTLSTVTHKFVNGVSDVYNFTFNDGRSTRCGIDHNWEVYDRAGKQWKVKTTEELLKTGVEQTPVITDGKIYKNYRYAIRQTEAIPFTQTTSLPIDPYVLGTILGDGSINDSVNVCGIDTEVFTEIQRRMGPDYEVKKNTSSIKYNISYKKRFDRTVTCNYKNGKYGVNPLVRELNELGLQVNRKGNKFIPDIYQYASIEDRVSMIQGLMDTNGYVNAQGNDIHFTNTNKDLVDGITFIARSLGIKITVDEKPPAQTSHKIYYRVRFSGDIKYPIFHLTRKVERFNKRLGKSQTHILTPLTGIYKLPDQELSSCIMVDNPNHLYITKDLIVTHNSYFHAAKLINQYYFEKGATLKLLASQDSYIGEEGTWVFLSEYRDFLNEHTAWYRPSDPDKIKNWQQKIGVEINGRKTNVGNKSRLIGISTQQSPTRGVGGGCKYAVFEEAGIAPTMDKTYRYMKPALESGLITTGMFIAYGSVGDLHQCEPLKKFMFYAKENGFYAVETNLVDENGTIARMGLFIPEQWSMPPFICPYGNSLVEEALAALLEKRAKLKKELTPEDYQLEISQHPINIAEAFAYRTEAIFPPQHVSQQMKRIEDGEYATQFIELDEVLNVITSKLSNRLPITEFPISKKLPNKEGVLVVFERPDTDPKWGMYTASIDPVAVGKTLTSDSLCSIIVYKNPVVRIKHSNDGIRKPKLEGDKIVATWCGRYDDLKKTHKQLEMIIRWYNAWTICEVNVSQFVNYMIERNLQHFLVQKDQVLFLKELSSNNGYHEYGWKNTGAMFKTNLIPYGVSFLSEEIDHEMDEDGTVTRIKYGVERIPDIMILKEMKEYRHGLNVDRLIAYCALIAFVRIQYASRGNVEIHEYDKKLENPLKNVKLIVSPFRNMGGQQSSILPQYRTQRSAFRNFR